MATMPKSAVRLLHGVDAGDVSGQRRRHLGRCAVSGSRHLRLGRDLGRALRPGRELGGALRFGWKLGLGGKLRLGGEALGPDDRPDTLGCLGTTAALALGVQLFQRRQRTVHIGDVLFQPLKPLGCQAFAHPAQRRHSGRRWSHG